MAVILSELATGKRCAGCGLELKDSAPIIVWTGFRDVAYMHPDCAKSLGQQLIADVAQLIDFGYYEEPIEDG
jgi:hypothetical protein